MAAMATETAARAQHSKVVHDQFLASMHVVMAFCQDTSSLLLGRA
jgi:hypothetical protein